MDSSDDDVDSGPTWIVRRRPGGVGIYSATTGDASTVMERSEGAGAAEGGIIPVPLEEGHETRAPPLELEHRRANGAFPSVTVLSEVHATTIQGIPRTPTSGVSLVHVVGASQAASPEDTSLWSDEDLSGDEEDVTVTGAVEDVVDKTGGMSDDQFWINVNEWRGWTFYLSLDRLESWRRLIEWIPQRIEDLKLLEDIEKEFAPNTRAHPIGRPISPDWCEIARLIPGYARKGALSYIYGAYLKKKKLRSACARLRVLYESMEREMRAAYDEVYPPGDTHLMSHSIIDNKFFAEERVALTDQIEMHASSARMMEHRVAYLDRELANELPKFLVCDLGTCDRVPHAEYELAKCTNYKCGYNICLECAKSIKFINDGYGGRYPPCPQCRAPLQLDEKRMIAPRFLPGNPFIC